MCTVFRGKVGITVGHAQMTTADKLLSNFVLRLVKEIPQSRFLSYLLFVTDATDNVNEKNWARSMSLQILPKCSVDIGLEIIPLQKKLCRQYNTHICKMLGNDD